MGLAFMQHFDLKCDLKLSHFHKSVLSNLVLSNDSKIHIYAHIYVTVIIK